MKRILVVTCLTLTVLAGIARAQSLRDRIDAVREQRRQADRQPQAQPQNTLQIPRKMRTIIDEVFFDQTPARDVFNWWSTTADIPLVIDWDTMEQIEGIDPEQPITLDLKTVPAKLLLKVLMKQASPHVDLVYEATPWYVQVMTKRQANRNTVLRVYDVADMVMRVPNFTNAPQMNISAALSNTNTGGGGSGRSGGGGGSGGGSGGGTSQIFGADTSNNEEDAQPTKAERGQELADMIRSTIEPDIWQANGGPTASVRYYNGRLIVNAPMYVHRQIGIPVSAVRAVNPGTAAAAGPSASSAGGTAAPSAHKPFGKPKR
jgi:hypothetical protein